MQKNSGIYSERCVGIWKQMIAVDRYTVLDNLHKYKKDRLYFVIKFNIKK